MLAERKTLPTNLPGPSSRRQLFKKKLLLSTDHAALITTAVETSDTSVMINGTFTSCSLPETPVFTRSSDISRAPHRGTRINNSRLHKIPYVGR